MDSESIQEFEVPTEKPRRKMGLGDVLLLVLTIAFGWGGFRADDPWVIYPCLLISMGCLIVLWWIHFNSWSRLVGVAVITILYCAGAGRIYYHTRALEQEDVANHLDFGAEIRSQDNIRSTVVSLMSGGKIGISYKFGCPIRLLITVDRSEMHEGRIRDHVRQGKLRAGMSAQYDDCLSALSVPVQNIICVDIRAEVQYSLDDQPKEIKEKKQGFVARKIGDQFRWDKYGDIESQSDCQKFVDAKPSHWEIEKQNQLKIRENNRRVIDSHSINHAKHLAVSLSESIFDFANERETTFPKEANELSDDSRMMETIEKVKKWDGETDGLFESKFRKLINSSFREMEKAHIDTGPAKTWCNPPPLSRTVDVMRHCAYGIGILAGGLPN